MKKGIMTIRKSAACVFAAILGLQQCAMALEKPDVTYKIFQFPANAIPRIDGDKADWDIVPEDYIIGTDQLARDNWSGQKPDPKNVDVKVKVGWVKGMNRLYILYEATDNFWDFTRPDGPGPVGDIFELVVDGDRSGGPLISRFHPATQPIYPPPRGTLPDPPEVPAADRFVGAREAWFSFQGNHAQNYHIYTPAEGKDWALAWGPQAAWIKSLPYSNVSYNYSFKQGEPGKLIMELMITPFDYAGAEGPARAVESQLSENKIIGMAWAVLDADGGQNQFWNLSPKHTMYGQASELCTFKLMPIEPKLQKTIDAKWSFKVVDLQRRIVAFQDESIGKITSWSWDFGDNTKSTEANPIHTYEKPGNYVVTLSIEGPDGKAKLEKVWDVTLK